jgi:hypothetical protein
MWLDAWAIDRRIQRNGANPWVATRFAEKSLHSPRFGEAQMIAGKFSMWEIYPSLKKQVLIVLRNLRRFIRRPNFVPT